MGDKSKSSASLICSICYEDLRPVEEDLQSVSVCGHVFHELCLQQWLEYCPANKKASCPFCKCACTERDVHRLFFQSLAEQSKGSPISSHDNADAKALRERLMKLEGRLTVATSAVTFHQEQIKDLAEQLLECKTRAEKAEASRNNAVREKVNLIDVLQKKEEEFNAATAECSRLRERSAALAKELAAHKLVANLDMEEDQVLKLASVGRGSNKDEIIDTLRKSLVIRNKSYKELMQKCNQLGAGESQSQRKLDKAFEKIKRLKARVQQLEKTMEEKENAVLRHLAKTKNGFSGQDAADVSNMPSGNKEASFQELHNAAASKQHSSTEFTEKSGLPVRLPVEEPFPKNGKNGICDVASGGKSKPAEIERETSCSPLSHFSTADETVRDHPYLELFDMIEEQDAMLMGIQDQASFLPIRKEIAGGKRLRPSVFGDGENENASGAPVALNAVPRKWDRSGTTATKAAFTQHKAGGSFIAVGADGRGGNIKVLKSIHSEWGSRPTSQLNRPAKRLKTSTGKSSASTGTGGLQIDHFFQKKSQA